VIQFRIGSGSWFALHCIAFYTIISMACALPAVPHNANVLNNVSHNSMFDVA